MRFGRLCRLLSGFVFVAVLCLSSALSLADGPFYCIAVMKETKVWEQIQLPDNITANRYGARAGDFIRSASILCQKRHVGWLPSACMLLGFACELLAKRRLLLEEIPEKDLRKAPYGHDISGMWREKTSLFFEAKELVDKRKLGLNSVTEKFDWGMHFDQLAAAHSSVGDYSLRYHQGEIYFADPKALTIVLADIWRAEQANM